MEHLRRLVRKVAMGALFCGMLPFSTHAQCDITITAASVYEDCDSYNTPLAFATWSGGAAPFTVSFVISSGLWGQFPTWDDYWTDYLSDIPDGTQQATITVTDAMGCTASTTVLWTDHVPMVPDVSFTLDCTVGPTLRWSGLYSPAPYSVSSLCPGPFNFHYQIM